MALAALTLGACSSAVTGGTGGTGGTGTATLHPPPGQIVFQARTAGGGPTPLEYYLGNRPGVTVYGSGVAYVVRTEEGRGYPGRPLAFVKGAVPPDVLAGLVRDAASSGLFDGADYGQAQILDAGGVSVSFRPGARAAQRVDVYALDITEADKRLSLRQRANRIALRRFVERLESSVVLGDAQLPPVWVPDRVDVTESVSRDAGDAPVAIWPGPALEGLLKTAGTRPRCGVLTGADARTVYSAARAHGTIRWQVGDGERLLVIRALLPGEPGCA